MAEDSSAREAALHPHTKLTVIRPYTTCTGPPALIPVARAVETPNQELASEKPIPITDNREKFFRSS